jgi:Acetyltransferase (GNAT) domain
MSEAIRRVLQYAFNELNLHSVEARVDSENISSLKVLEKIGFAREGYLKECSFNKGQFRDNVIFSLLRGELFMTAVLKSATCDTEGIIHFCASSGVPFTELKVRQERFIICCNSGPTV